MKKALAEQSRESLCSLESDDLLSMADSHSCCDDDDASDDVQFRSLSPSSVLSTKQIPEHGCFHVRLRLKNGR